MTTKVSLIADNAIVSAGISDETITNDDIKDSTITTDKIAFGSALVPLGGIIMWSGSTAPSGYQLCNGSNLPGSSPLRPGITKTPDLRDRFIVGSGSNYAIGATGGSIEVKLEIDEIPSHNHGGGTKGQTANHRHAFPGDDQLSFGDGVGGWSSTAVGYFGYDAASKSSGGQGTMWLTAENNQDHAHDINLQGGGLAHENRPPYYALAFIMRVL
jgi:microcystin-dependent protein